MSVWLCSGQGAQAPGMGSDLLDLPRVADVFARMSEGMGLDLARLAREGSADEVNEAVAAQALTMAVSVGVAEELKEHGRFPSAVVGFSLGQISALVVAESLSLEDATRLLGVRARAMARACVERPGGMAALMGGDPDEVAELCAECAQGQVLVPANRNAPGQIVISGESNALDRALASWNGRAGRRATKLNTAGAFHSPLMAEAAQEVCAVCEALHFDEPRIELLCNTDARPFAAAQAAERLSRHMVQGVLFEQSLAALAERGERTFMEVGHGGVLTGLVRRNFRKSGIEVEAKACGTRPELEARCIE